MLWKDSILLKSWSRERAETISKPLPGMPNEINGDFIINSNLSSLCWKIVAMQVIKRITQMVRSKGSVFLKILTKSKKEL